MDDDVVHVTSHALVENLLSSAMPLRCLVLSIVAMFAVDGCYCSASILNKPFPLLTDMSDDRMVG